MVSNWLPLTEDSLISYWLRSGLTWVSIEQHRERIPRYLLWLREQGVEAIPARRATSSREAHEFARADNLLTLQVLQASRNPAYSGAAHHLRNYLRVRPWRV